MIYHETHNKNTASFSTNMINFESTQLWAEQPKYFKVLKIKPNHRCLRNIKHVLKQNGGKGNYPLKKT